MPLIDSHCHLNHENLLKDLPGVLARAGESGVARIVVGGFDLPSSRTAVTLAAQHNKTLATVGVHPHDADTYDDAAADELKSLAQGDRVVAYGEIGLDYHYDNSPRDEQRAAFRLQLQLAQELELPVVIHSRDAAADTRTILEEVGLPDAGGVMHCFAYGVEEMDWVLELGMYIGITGVVTFKKAENIREVARATPLDRLLLETDAPYLAPVPYRGKRNEPSYLPYVAAAVAEARGESVEAITEAATVNTVGMLGESVQP